MSEIDYVRKLAAIHRLVDELPVEAFDATFRVLEIYTKWPPKGHADAEKMLAASREHWIRRNEEHARRTGTGMISATGGSGSFSPDGYGHSSSHGWEGHTSVTAAVHFFRGYELHTTERMSISDDKKTLRYLVEAKLPGNEPQQHEFKFTVSA